MSITPVPTSRVSDLLVRQRLLSQLQVDQLELFRLQTSVSSGRRIILPSEDASASLRAMGLQRLIERKEQVQVNLSTNQSFLTSSDDALSDVTSLVNNVRSLAIAVHGDQVSETERAAGIDDLDRSLQQLVNVGNRVFRGRYLFGGSNTQDVPFVTSGEFIKYQGNENAISSLADLGLLLESNVNGHEVFGGLSTQVAGTVDLDPILTRETSLRDLRGGVGINDGSISLAVGTATQVVDISGAETIGEVADLIENNSPTGVKLTVTVTSRGLNIAADAGALTIKEVAGGTTATELGILEETGTLGQPIIGEDIGPHLRLTTRLDDIVGSRSLAEISSPGVGNGILVEANRRGAEHNDVAITFVDDAGVIPGNETVAYDPIAKTLEIHIDAGNSTAAQVVDALNSDAAFAADFSSSLDPREIQVGALPGSGSVDVAATATTFDGSGEEFDLDHGIQIVNADQTFDVSLAGAETIEDLLNAINGLNASGAAVTAELNADRTGINVRSTLSGADFSIGENGGTTASHLGIRSLGRETALATLNHGLGVGTRDGADFTVRRADGVELEIDVSSAKNVGDVLDAVNNHALNQDGDNRVVAQLNTFGNGIEFVSANPSSAANFEIVRNAQSPAAPQLHIIPEGSVASEPAVNVDAANVQLSLAGANTDLWLTATQAGPQRNGVDVLFVDDGSVTGDNATVAFDGAAGTLTVFIDSTPGTGTTADTIRQQINADGNFQADLDTLNDPTNDGSGVVTDLGNVGTTSGGTARVSGSDPNPGEVRGLFSAMVLLRDAMADSNTTQVNRAVEMLDEGLSGLNFARAEIGSRQLALDGLQTRLELEEIDLRGTLSEEIDVDLAEAISEMTARQVSLEATLRLTGAVSQLTLLDFL